MTLARICGQCQTLLKPENTSSLGCYQPDCNDCTQKHLISLDVKYRKLLEFTKRMSDCGDICCHICIEKMAEELLKEIGELE